MKEKRVILLSLPDASVDALEELSHILEKPLADAGYTCVLLNVNSIKSLSKDEIKNEIIPLLEQVAK